MNGDVLAQNRSGAWVPSIPLPIYIGRKKVRCCTCPLVFKSEEAYRGHYALKHVLELD